MRKTKEPGAAPTATRFDAPDYSLPVSHGQAANDFALAHHYYTLRRYDAARPYLECVLAIGGDNDTRSTALYELAVLEQTEGKREAAEQHLREAIRLAPHIAGYQRALATLLRAPT
ncbi:MAG TPA: tetratricopeptide repeat protein [Terriglobales bacterium]